MGLSTRFTVLGTRYSVLGTRYSVLGTRYSVLGTRYSVEVTMRILTSWGLAASLVVGLGAAVTAAADDDSEGSSAKPSARAPTWQWKPLDAFFGPTETKKPPEKKASPKPEPT